MVQIWSRYSQKMGISQPLKSTKSKGLAVMEVSIPCWQVEDILPFFPDFAVIDDFKEVHKPQTLCKFSFLVEATTKS